jgi:hypothetical protein
MPPLTTTGGLPGFMRRHIHVVGPVTAALPVMADTYAAYRQGKNVPGEFVKSTFHNAWPFLLTMGMRGASLWGGLLAMAPVAPMVASSLYSLVEQRSHYLRQSHTPFSHSFNHSDYSLMAQQRGMQTISGVRSMIGSEAGAMAQRYARR